MTLRQTMLLDPPWAERGAGKSKRGADKHYPVMTTQQILSTIMGSGLWTPDTRGCSVWMWATANYLADALWLMHRLGATYVTNVVWVKAERQKIIAQHLVTALHSTVDVVVPEKPSLGQRVRMCHEHLLFGRIGKVPVPEPADRLPSVIYAPRGKHSAKPDEAYHLVETHDGLAGNAKNALEWFAREQRPGWDSWGNEVPGVPSKPVQEAPPQPELIDDWARVRG